MAQYQVTAAILGVVQSATAKGTPMWTVQLSSGEEYRVFKRPPAEKAMSFVGQGAVTILLEEKGDFTNFVDVVGVAGPGAAVVPAVAPQGQTQFTQTPDPGKKDKTINRSVGVKVAASLVAELLSSGVLSFSDDPIEEVAEYTTALAGKLARYIGEGPSKGADAAVVPAAVAALPTLPAGVTAEQVAAWAAAQGTPVEVGVAAEEQGEEEAY